MSEWSKNAADILKGLETKKDKPIYRKEHISTNSDICWMCGETFYKQWDLARHNLLAHDTVDDLWWHKIENEIRH